MNYQNLFKIAIRAIAANKMRSFLTALGIIIGIAAVITMLAIPSLQHSQLLHQFHTSQSVQLHDALPLHEVLLHHHLQQSRPINCSIHLFSTLFGLR